MHAPDLVVFTSSSAVKNFAALCGENGKHLLRTATAAVLGPITARTVAGFGKRPEILPCESTVASLIEAIRHHYER